MASRTASIAEAEYTGCPIDRSDPTFVAYHDQEWGRPVGDDRRLFEKVCLETFQAGLSWQLILHRREHLREAFHRFDPARVARMRPCDVEQLLLNPRLVRNRRKIEACIHNAACALELQREAGSLARFFWSFEPATAQRPVDVTREWLAENPQTDASRRLSVALKQRGWRMVGPTTLYALMQACGLVNDHVQNCPMREPVEQSRAAFPRPQASLA